MDDLVSVLMPVYKEPIELLEKSVQSIIDQSYSNIELIVVIDSSERQDLLAWFAKIKDTRIRVFTNETNNGLIYTLNRGIGLCNGEYIARMDADDISLPDRLDKQLRYLKKNNCDLVSGSVKPIINDFVQNRVSRLPESDKGIRILLENYGSIPHPTWLVKKKVYEDLQGYREIKHAEDYDFLLRAAIRGYKFGNIKECCLYYRQNLDGISQTNKAYQMVLALELQKQLVENRIKNPSDILGNINENSQLIEKYDRFFKYSRAIRNMIYIEHNVDIKWIIKHYELFFFVFEYRRLRQNIVKMILSLFF